MSPVHLTNAVGCNGYGLLKSPISIVQEIAAKMNVAVNFKVVRQIGPPHQRTFTTRCIFDGRFECTGDGSRKQISKTIAASNMLEKLKSHNLCFTDEHLPAGTPPVQPCALLTWNCDCLTEHQAGDELFKSPISLVQEIAAKQKVLVDYEVIKEIGPPHAPTFTTRCTFGDKFDSIGEAKCKQISKTIAAANMLEKLKSCDLCMADGGIPAGISPEQPCTLHSENCDCTIEQQAGDGLFKSPISLVQEIAAKQNVPVDYEVIREIGPPHAPTFTTRCIFGDKFDSTGEGKCKQISKMISAANMLEKLKSYPKLVLVDGDILDGMPPMKPCTPLSRKCACSEEQQADDGVDGNDSSIEISYPIPLVYKIVSRLNLPIDFQYIHKKSSSHQPIFIVRCTVGDQFETIGEGVDKKASKTQAAEKMLEHFKTLPGHDDFCLVHEVVSIKRRHLLRRHRVSTTLHGQQSSKQLAVSLDSLINWKYPMASVEKIAIKLNLKLSYENIKSSSNVEPFVTRCICGDKSIIGKGDTRKVSKVQAAESMLKLLTSPSPLTGPRIDFDASEYSQVNIQQVKQEKEPAITLKEDPAGRSGASRDRPFVTKFVQHDIENPAKLRLLESDEAFKAEDSSEDGDALSPWESVMGTSYQSNDLIRGRRSRESRGSCGCGRRGAGYFRGGGSGDEDELGSLGRRGMAGNNIKIENSPDEDQSDGNLRRSCRIRRSSDRLRDLAEALNSTVVFIDSPNKGNGALSEVSLGINSSRVWQGFGPTINVARDQAASKALQWVRRCWTT